MPAAERVAVFDNDGTLWCEKSMPIQLAYVLQQLAAIAERDHAWLGGAIVKHYQGDDGDLQRLLGGGLATLDGVDVDDATAWLAEDTRPPG